MMAVRIEEEVDLAPKHGEKETMFGAQPFDISILILQRVGGRGGWNGMKGADLLGSIALHAIHANTH